MKADAFTLSGASCLFHTRSLTHILHFAIYYHTFYYPNISFDLNIYLLTSSHTHINKYPIHPARMLQSDFSSSLIACVLEFNGCARYMCVCVVMLMRIKYVLSVPLNPMCRSPQRMPH